MAVKQLYLIRHAQPDFPSGEKMCLGRKLDLPLSAEGVRQAHALGCFFSQLNIEAVYTSPLLRARQTADLIAGSRRPVHVLEELIELDGGEWDGLTFSQLRSRYPDSFGHGKRKSCPPGGERDEDGLRRAHAALSIIAERTQTCAAAVAHSGIDRVLLCDLLGRPFSEKRELPHGHAAVSLLEYQDGCWTVKQLSVSI